MANNRGAIVADLDRSCWHRHSRAWRVWAGGRMKSPAVKTDRAEWT